MSVLRLVGNVAGWALRFMRRDKKAAAGAIILFILLLITAFPTWFTPHDPASEAYPNGVGLSWSHLLGTTSLGQDVDRPEDLVRVARDGLGPRTSSFLRERLGAAASYESSSSLPRSS